MYIKSDYLCHYPHTGAVVVHHVEDVDQAEKDSYQETHPPRNYIWRDDEWGPGNEDKEAGGNVVNNEVFVVLTADVNIKPRERKIAQLTVVVQVQTRADKYYHHIEIYPLKYQFAPPCLVVVIVIVPVSGISEGNVVIKICVLLVNSAIYLNIF